MKRSIAIALSAAALTVPRAGVSSQQVAPTSDFLLHWPAATGADAKYNSIDGRRMQQYVVELAKIATDFRDSGHPQWWGRITGTSGDKASAEWLMAKYRQIGLADVHAQPMFLFMPQWNARSWSVNLVGVDGRSVNLVSATPPYGAADTGNREIDLEVVSVGNGAAADFLGRDVRGKAVLITKERSGWNFVAADVSRRAVDGGAAAIFVYDFRGANRQVSLYRAATGVPTFHLGTADGNAMREAAGGATPAHVKIRVDADWNGGQNSALVWGTLPGTTDETIYIIAHLDGWYEAAGDNAVGVAGMIGLAEYFAKIPQAQRRRTIHFVGLDGHHNRPGAYGRVWMAANHERLFPKTALMINIEHPAQVATRTTQDVSNQVYPNAWYAGGGQRPKLEQIAKDAFHEFGVPIWGRPSGSADLGIFTPFVPGLALESDDFVDMHTEMDGPQVVHWAGLESAIRAYAKIIDEVNELPLSDLQRPNGELGSLLGLDISKCQAWIEDSSKPCTP